MCVCVSVVCVCTLIRCDVIGFQMTSVRCKLAVPVSSNEVIAKRLGSWCVCVCVRERESVCVCVREREH